MGRPKKNTINVKEIEDEVEVVTNTETTKVTPKVENKCDQCGGTMTSRGPDTMVCSKCHMWKKNPKYKESIEEKKRRLKAELESLGGD